MDFEKKVPEWDNVGAEPDAQLKKEGFKAGYKPPAAYFNWFFNRISEVAKELQEKAGNEIDNKPDASGGDISDTVITSAEEPTAEYPVPAAGDSTKVFLGKTRKFFSDIKNWMTGVCMLGQIVNNCVTDNAKLPLSAAQGKSLMDLYNVLNTNQQKGVINNEAITTLSNPSQLTHAGFYRIAACSADVNSQVEADSMKFTAYTTGDFYAFLLGHQVTTSGCRYGTLVITSPRFVGTFWIARIWEYKFVGWFKFTAA